MTISKSHNRIRAALACLVLALIISGCGFNPDNKVYDTKANPDNFPKDALVLLDGIDDGSLSSYDGITTVFGELYVNHSDLLDNRRWQDVVTKLGLKFRLKADSLVKQGAEFYSHAAGLYQLASFARPNDEIAKEKNDLFSLWKESENDISLSTYKEIKGKNNLAYQISRARNFVFGDSLHRAFADKYLIENVLKPVVVANADELVKMPPSYRAFVSSQGLGEPGLFKPVKSFENPSVDLVAYDIVALDDSTWRAELYFLPKEEIKRDYRLTIRAEVKAADGTLEVSDFPYDSQLLPKPAIEPEGRIFAVTKVMQPGAELTAISIGIDQTDDLFRLPKATGSGK